MSVLSKSGLKLSACDINLYDWMFAKWHTIHRYFHAIYLLTRMSWSVGCLRPSIICCKVGVPTPNLPANSSISAEQWSSKSAVHSTQNEEKKDNSSNTQRPYSLVVERLQVHLFHMSIIVKKNINLVDNALLRFLHVKEGRQQRELLTASL